YSRWKGSILHPLIGCYLTLPLFFFGINPGSLSTLVGAYCFRRRWRGIERECTPSWRRVLTLVVCGLLYTGLWSSYLYYNAEVVHNGDKIKLRDAVGNFLKSPLAQEFGRSLGEHWKHMKEQGFWSTYTRFIDSLDPFGEKNALKVLGLQPGATQEEIRSKYRELSKQWHPDK
ncbi:dnaJ homolog subfamily C member 22, partial [Eurytemora carolleeae]|uniref:dnaJ homolog subfamily C member 22 n=1 Tax=Eurytemora carolleeae TaxID=1294199 RepID=UPI000C774F6C